MNKEYLNQKFLKKDKDGNYYDLKWSVIKNSEHFNSIYDDQSLVPKKYIDDVKADKTYVDFNFTTQNKHNTDIINLHTNTT